jgi:hypothetical protein
VGRDIFWGPDANAVTKIKIDVRYDLQYGGTAD